jgi:hypothetical protein
MVVGWLGDGSVFAEEGVGAGGAGGGFAQDVRCPAAGKRVMSSPISAMIARAAVAPVPGISSSRVIARVKGAISCSIRSSITVMSASTASIWASMRAGRNP